MAHFKKSFFTSLLLSLLFIFSPAFSATYDVNSTDDVVDANPGDGECDSTLGSNICTLRAAIMEANATAGPHTINVPAGVYNLTIAEADDTDGSTGDLDTSSEIQVQGSGSSETIIDGQNAHRIFDATSGALTLMDLRIQNGAALDPLPNALGGGVKAVGANLTLNRVEFTGNSANQGGAVEVLFNTTEIIDSQFYGNTIENTGQTNPRGSAIFARASISIIRTAVFDNSYTAETSVTGAIYLGDESAQIINSTVTGNTGSGIYIQSADTLVSHSTIADNSLHQIAAFVGSTSEATVEIFGSVLQGGTSAACDDGMETSLGYNISSDSSCNFSATGDLEDTDALLDSLKSNGGPTKTRALRAGSPAIDLVPLASCVDDVGATLTEDQRGFPRPARESDICDAGAYEWPGPDIFKDRFET